jgi:hypothetical protein
VTIDSFRIVFVATMQRLAVGDANPHGRSGTMRDAWAHPAPRHDAHRRAIDERAFLYPPHVGPVIIDNLRACTVYAGAVNSAVPIPSHPSTSGPVSGGSPPPAGVPPPPGDPPIPPSAQKVATASTPTCTCCVLCADCMNGRYHEHAKLWVLLARVMMPWRGRTGHQSSSTHQLRNSRPQVGLLWAGSLAGPASGDAALGY